MIEPMLEISVIVLAVAIVAVLVLGLVALGLGMLAIIRILRRFLAWLRWLP